MKWYILILILAGVGILSGLWLMLGVFFSGGRGGQLVCVCRPGGAELSFVRRMRLLRELELLRCPMVLIDRGMDEEVRALAEASGYFTICTPEDFLRGLELEWNEIG